MSYTNSFLKKYLLIFIVSFIIALLATLLSRFLFMNKDFKGGQEELKVSLELLEGRVWWEQTGDWELLGHPVLAQKGVKLKTEDNSRLLIDFFKLGWIEGEEGFKGELWDVSSRTGRKKMTSTLRIETGEVWAGIPEGIGDYRLELITMPLRVWQEGPGIINVDTIPGKSITVNSLNGLTIVEGELVQGEDIVFIREELGPGESYQLIIGDGNFVSAKSTSIDLHLDDDSLVVLGEFLKASERGGSGKLTSAISRVIGSGDYDYVIRDKGSRLVSLDQKLKDIKKVDDEEELDISIKGVPVEVGDQAELIKDLSVAYMVEEGDIGKNLIAKWYLLEAMNGGPVYIDFVTIRNVGEYKFRLPLSVKPEFIGKDLWETGDFLLKISIGGETVKEVTVSQ